MIVVLIIMLGLCIKAYIDGLVINTIYPFQSSNPIQQQFQRTQIELIFTIIQVVLMGVSLIWSALAAYQAYQQQFYICSNGLLRLQGKKEEAIRWDKVAEVYGSSDSLSALLSTENFLFAIDQYKSKELNSTVIDEVVRRLLQKAIESYDAGVPLPFGYLQIVRNGISDHGYTVPWAKIEEIQEKKGKLAIRMHGKWQKWVGLRRRSGTGWYTRKKGVTNLPVFVGLVKHVMSLH